MSDLSADKVLNNSDTMCMILLLLPPETIYKLILVSKRWLQIISSPCFRRMYLTKWKPRYELIGFFSSSTSYLGERKRPSSEPALPFLSTSSCGNELKCSGTLEKLGYFIDSSNGILLCGRHPAVYYLWDPSTKKRQELPRPPVLFKELRMSLITENCPDKGSSYKVIRAECCYADQSTIVRVQTFSSKTNTWSYSELSYHEPISLTWYSPGRVINGVVYWHAMGGKLAMYDSNSEVEKINVIKLPERYDYDDQVLGETEDGCLQYGWSNESEMEIWKLDKINNVFQFNIMWKVDFRAMWGFNERESRIFSIKSKQTRLLAFLSQKSNLIYISCKKHIFIYDLMTQQVRKVYYDGRLSLDSWEFERVVPYTRPCWPSSRLFGNDVDDPLL